MNDTTHFTTGDLARIAECPLHRVTYVMQRYHIREDARAGAYRLYQRDRLPELLALIRDLKEGTNDA